MRKSKPPRVPPDRRGGHRHVAVLSVGLAIYLVGLWLGIVVIGDTPVRSALMAGLIVSIAVAGYTFTRRPSAPDD